MKKFLTAGLTIVLAAALMTGCNTSKKAEEQTTAVKAETENITVDYGKGLNEDGTLKEINRISEKLNRTVICTAIIAVILMVPLMIIHKNKWRPVRNFGIALWVSQLGTCLIWLLLFIATAAAYEEKFVERSSESDAVIGHLVKNMVGGITLFYFALLILGFVIMGVAIKMIGITNDKIIDSEDGAGSYDNEDGMGYRDYNDPSFSPVNME